MIMQLSSYGYFSLANGRYNGTNNGSSKWFKCALTHFSPITRAKISKKSLKLGKSGTDIAMYGAGMECGPGCVWSQNGAKKCQKQVFRQHQARNKHMRNLEISQAFRSDLDFSKFFGI